jgi:hypothetical protein
MGFKQKIKIKQPQTHIPKGFYIVLLGLLIYQGFSFFGIRRISIALHGFEACFVLKKEGFRSKTGAFA